MNTLPAEDSHVLIVEDEPVIGNYLRLVLHSMGFSTSFAADGDEAATCLASDRIPIVLTDMHMPVMDGMALLTHIRVNYPETDVVVMTGFTDQYAYEKVIAAGAVDYLIKPVNEFELKAKLLRLVRDRKTSRQLREEIACREQAEQALLKANAALEERVAARTLELEETNTALRVLLRRRDEEQKELRQEVTRSILEALTPCFDSVLKEVPPASAGVLHSTYHGLTRMLAGPESEPGYLPYLLTQREQQVVAMIEQGQSSRQIAATLGLSIRTVESHRDRIRKKMGINHKKTNLKKIISLYANY